MVVSVAEAAELLGVHRSRVEQLLRSGRLRGRRAGRLWFVDERSVLEIRRAPGRPPPRAGAGVGLLDMLDGGAASWLSPVARSQGRARLRGLGEVDASRWRALLRHPSDVLDARMHPAASPQ